MGVSSNIAEQFNKDKEFQKYFEDRNAELSKIIVASKKDMEGQVSAFYNSGAWTDAKRLVSGSFQYVATASTWSLGAVQTVIDAICAAVFDGSHAPTPGYGVPTIDTGAAIDPADDVTKKLIAEMKKSEGVIANEAFRVVSGLVAAFKSPTDVAFTKSSAQAELVPGLTLFVTVMEAKFHSNLFFADETIANDFYLFDCRASAKRAQGIAKLDTLSQTVISQKALVDQAKHISSQIAALKFDDHKLCYGGSVQLAMKAYRADVAALEDVINQINKKIEIAAKSIERLRA